MRSDAELVRAARSDPAAFRELYGRYAHQIYGFHVRRVRDVDAAHELTAETFAQAWQSRRRFRDRASGSAGPWLIGIARHVIAQSVRRRRVELAACAKLGMLEAARRPALDGRAGRELAGRTRRGTRRASGRRTPCTRVARRRRALV